MSTIEVTLALYGKNMAFYNLRRYEGIFKNSEPNR
jgi:hypothetical protein